MRTCAGCAEQIPDVGVCPHCGTGPGGTLPPATNGMAIASLTLGIVWLGGLGSVLAVVFGGIARSQIRETGDRGRGLATAGIVLGALGLLATALFVVALFVAVVSGAEHGGL